MGANSILIEQARRFTLLVGHYSREHFNEPGPAFLYVQAWGESLFYDALHVVPTPWNGQLIALYALNALFAASVVAVGYGWTRSVGGAAATLAVVAPARRAAPDDVQLGLDAVRVRAGLLRVRGRDRLGGGRAHPGLLAGGAGGLVPDPRLRPLPALRPGAGGRGGGGGPVAALAGTGQAEKPISNGPCFHPRARRVWIPVAAISAVFALPIVIELALHWPGNFAKYFSYSSSSKSSGHTPPSWSRTCSGSGGRTRTPGRCRRPGGRRRPARLAAAQRPAAALLRGPAGGRRPLHPAVHRLRDGRDRLAEQLLLRRLLLLVGAAAGGPRDRPRRDRAAARPDRRGRRRLRGGRRRGGVRGRPADPVRPGPRRPARRRPPPAP